MDVQADRARPEQSQTARAVPRGQVPTRLPLPLAGGRPDRRVLGHGLGRLHQNAEVNIRWCGALGEPPDQVLVVNPGTRGPVVG